MKQRYRFAHIFVRLSRILGVLALVSGVIVAGLKVYVCLSEASSIKYHPSAELDLRLENLEAETARTSLILRRVLTAASTLPEITTFPKFQKKYTSTDDFEQLDQLLAQMKEGRNELKRATIREFERTIEGVLQKLLAHAESVAGPRKTVETPASSLQQHPASTPSSQSMGAEEEHLFTDLSNDDRHERTAKLIQVRTYLEQMEQESQKTENKNLLKDALLQLAALMRLIPSPLRVAPLQEATTTEAQPVVKVRDEVRAERVASELASIKEFVRQEVLDSWKLDAAFESAYLKAATEKERCEQAEIAHKIIMISGLEWATASLIAGAALSFLILVFADFLQSQLDIAMNTGKLVVAYGLEPGK